MGNVMWYFQVKGVSDSSSDGRPDVNSTFNKKDLETLGSSGSELEGSAPVKVSGEMVCGFGKLSSFRLRFRVRILPNSWRLNWGALLVSSCPEKRKRR